MSKLFEVDGPGPLGVLKPCTAAPPGSGPSGKTCRSCVHYKRVKYHEKVHLKCGLMEHHWTHGPGTDIKAGWPACREYDESGKQA